MERRSSTRWARRSSCSWTPNRAPRATRTRPGRAGVRAPGGAAVALPPRLGALGAQPPRARSTPAPTWSPSTTLALEARERTGGLFDPTVHDALVAAGYDRTFDDVVADGPAVSARSVRRAGARRGTDASSSSRGFRLDLGGIAKGYAVDRAAELLGAAGPCLVNAGGDLAARGRSWPVGVETADGQITLALEDGAIATSGRDRRRWRRGRRRGAPPDRPGDRRTGRRATSCASPWSPRPRSRPRSSPRPSSSARPPGARGARHRRRPNRAGRRARHEGRPDLLAARARERTDRLRPADKLRARGPDREVEAARPPGESSGRNRRRTASSRCSPSARSHCTAWC